ncbi:Chaperone protein dnak [Thalictrum thalictroides]|uniref:Chaperone protein dnak n=1 Tax=Thalictrum thalictroides TaxID=46969 RepID=A0A7J6WZF2_THATH|nr:Chaperone protein dnak [Thalictrum thalictroides]
MEKLWKILGMGSIRSSKSSIVVNNQKKSHFIGINLGTTNSYLAILENDGNNNNNYKPKVIKKFPSVIYLKGNDSTSLNPIFGFKRLVGRNFNDFIIQKEIKRNEILPFTLPYKIVNSKINEGEAWVETSYGHLCSPVKMLQGFLTKMKETAEKYIGNDSIVAGAVITYPPAKFTVSVLKATLEAAVMAGLVKNYVFTILEPIAVATSYGLQKEVEGTLIAVVDLGGRSLDVSILERVNSQTCFKTKGRVVSDMFLGGEDFDYILMKYFLHEIKNADGITTEILLSDLPKFRRLAEQTKIKLSSACETEILVPYIASSDNAGGSAEKHLTIKLTRSEFENLVGVLIDRIRFKCLSCLADAGISAKDVDKVLLVGGMARVPIVKQVVTEIFEKSPVRGPIAPDEAAALGAAVALYHRGCVGIHDSDFQALCEERL